MASTEELMRDRLMSQPGRIPMQDGLEDVGEIADAFMSALSEDDNPAEKTLRTFAIREAAEMIGCSVQYLRAKLGDSAFPQPEMRGNRYFYDQHKMAAYRELLDRVPRRPPEVTIPACVLGVYKGGCGKSTSATGLAVHLALRGHRVLLVDLDPQGSASQFFGFRPSRDVEYQDTIGAIIAAPDASTVRRPLAEVAQSTHVLGLDVVPAGIDLHELEMYLTAEVTGLRQPSGFESSPVWTRLREGINSVSDRYDLVLLDTPPSLNLVTLCAVVAATHLFVPTAPRTLDVESTLQFLTTLESWLEVLYQHFERPQFDKFLGLFITMLDTRAASDLTMAARLRKAFPHLVMNTQYQLSDAVKKAAERFCTVEEIEKYNGARSTLMRARENARQLFDEMAAILTADWQATT